MSSYIEQKNKILSFYRKNRRMPGYKEIMDMVGFKSKNAVYKLINKLVDDGVVSKDSLGKLTPNKLFGEIPLVGLVEAGLPTSDTDALPDSISIEDYLVKAKDSTYLLEVKGDSMIDEGIKEGDLVLVERSSQAKDGDIVIAMIDGGYTMKYLRKKGKGFYLEPANSKYKPIYPTYDFKVEAVVRGVIRKY